MEKLEEKKNYFQDRIKIALDLVSNKVRSDIDTEKELLDETGIEIYILMKLAFLQRGVKDEVKLKAINNIIDRTYGKNLIQESSFDDWNF